MQICQNVLDLSEELARTWLQTYMFAGEPDAHDKATAIADDLNDHGKHHVHSRFRDRDYLRTLGLKIDDLEEDQIFQDCVLTVLHSFSLTFTLAQPVQKIVENHAGKRFIKFVNMPRPVGPMAPPAMPPAPAQPQTGRMPAILKKVLKDRVVKLIDSL